jgi:nucleoside-diphosphate-sugar epimerase
MKIFITGGAGYIGSVLAGQLLSRGDDVTVFDDLWFGGDSVIALMQSDRFRLIKGDICSENNLATIMRTADCVVHLAALVGFPACEKGGRDYARRINVQGTQNVCQAANKAGVKRLIFASSYSNYGESQQGELVTETSPLQPKSIYAETKIEAERYLLCQDFPDLTAPTCLRLATVFGLSPRTRFDLIVNQFVLDAITKGVAEIYQVDFKRSFVHVRDVARAIVAIMDAPVEMVRNQVFNVGSESCNISKQKLVELIKLYIPDLKVIYRDISFASDMRSIHVSFEKIRRTLGFEAKISIAQGIEELLWAIQNKVISDPLNDRYRNHPAILV